MDTNLEQYEEYNLNDKYAPKKLKQPDTSKLNEEQLKAVQHDKGPVLVIAGAGSGKTSVIVNRTGLLVSKGVMPESILLITFTNKAAREMLNRAKIILDSEEELNVNALTYHAFCTKMLRKYSRQANVNNDFMIMTSSDTIDAMNLIKETHNYGKNKNFPSGKELINIFSTCINKEYVLDTYVNDCFPQYYEFLRDIHFLHEKYIDYKKDHNLMDYDDLLVTFLNLLLNYPEIAKQISDMYEYIMVDEYQDSNMPQMKILTQLRNKGNDNLMVVGDDFQSVYGFRGAEVQNILNFPKQFSNCEIIVLNKNYRSNQKILDFSNAITENAKEKFTKNLIGNRTDGIRPICVNVENQDIEARFILSKIEDFHENGIPYKNMAAIIRGSNNSLFLEKTLTQFKVPFKKFGGLSFLERKYVKDTLVFLKVFINEKDEISWFRLFQLYPDIGPTYAKRIATGIKEHGIAELKNESHVKKKYYPQLLKIIDTMDKLKKMSLKEQLEFLIDYRYDLTIDIINNSNRNDTSKTDSLKQNDGEYKESKLLLDMANGYNTALSFLTDITLEVPTNEEDSDYFNITTVHSAKGLEYDVVFIICCTDGVFPWDFPPKANTDGALLIKQKELEEERRVFYVAITRAKTHLYVLVPEKILVYGHYEKSIPSRYLTESAKTKETYGNLNVK